MIHVRRETGQADALAVVIVGYRQEDHPWQVVCLHDSGDNTAYGRDRN
jgi:hypothetical protein